MSGQHIEYTGKLPELSEMTADQTTVCMGELLFKRFGRYLPAHQIGGILNANKPRPWWSIPEIRLYRVDRIGRTNTHNLEFWANRSIQWKVADKSPYLGIVARVPLAMTRLTKLMGLEGAVGVPEGLSINEGHKIKWHGDEEDWTCTSVQLEKGGKGGIAGVAKFVTEDGRPMKLGPGQLGTPNDCLDMMKEPNLFEGRVAKVISKRGHSGRAGKLLSWHDDK